MSYQGSYNFCLVGSRMTTCNTRVPRHMTSIMYNTECIEWIISKP